MAKKITTEELRDLLVSTHIYYDAGTRSLKDRAFGEIITKILFLLPEKKARFSEIQDLVIKFVNVPNLTNQDIQSGLEFLKSKEVLNKQGKYWFLSKEKTDQVEKDLANSQERIKHILDKHFGTKIERTSLEKWFKLSVAEFYGKFSEVFSKRLKRQNVSLPSEELLLSVIKKPISELKMERHKDALWEGFRSFVRDTEDPIIIRQIWSFAQAMLSARLVYASLGPDPISIKEFVDTSLFLDTNVLFVASLEKSRLSSALSSLASSIHKIGSTLHITYETREEYKKVVSRKKREALRAVESLPFSVIENTKDIFIKTGISRGCVDKNSFEIFFNSIADVPESVGGERITIEDSPDLKKASYVGSQDQKRKDDIAEEWKKIHGYPKPQGSINHDASLDGAIDFLKTKGRNVKIITADTAMQSVSIKWAGSGNPTWIGLDTFIQLLAVSGAGPAHKAENFAPLLNLIIIDDIYANDAVFTLEDLDALLDLEERAKELSGEEIEKFASKLHRLVLSGRPKNDSELQLEIRRTFQRKKMDHGELAQNLESRAKGAEQNFSSEQKRRTSVEGYLLKKTTGEQLIKLYLLHGFLALLSIFVGITIAWLGYYAMTQNHNALGWFLIGIGIIEVILATIKWIIPKFKQIPKIAKEKADHIIKNIEEVETK